jgi:hypothetical protein
MTRYFFLLALLLGVGTALAAPADPVPGTYIFNRGMGSLAVRKDGQNRLSFEIETIGGNCHTCEVKGVIRNAIGHAESEDPALRCDIAFASGRSSVVVTPITTDACQSYCGARGSFDGTYRIPPAMCTASSRDAQRKKFLQLYRGRQYAAAANLLTSLSAQCADFMNWIEMDEVRNDLALAQYHQGKFAQCLQTLDKTVAAKVKDEAELKSGDTVHLPPCDFDNYIEVAKATWFNKSMCVKAMQKAR